MNNPNCPDTHYSEFDPATGECFHAVNIERVYHDHINQPYPFASRTVFLLLIGAVIGFVISRKFR